MLASSCDRMSMEHEGNEGPTTSSNYIMFTSDVDTKATLVNSMTGKNYYVLGYEYENTSDWATAKGNSTPDLFYNTKLTFSNGIWTYPDPKRRWNFHKKYSFFAYYPEANTANGISISGQNEANMPLITYTLPISNNKVDPTSIVDLMTASAINQTSSGSGIVKFVFKHRLFCIDISAENYDAKEYTLSDLSVTFEDVKYRKATLAMQKGYSEEDPRIIKEPRSGELTFDILDEITLKEKSNISLTGNNKNILLIPQDSSTEGFNGTINLTLDDGVTSSTKKVSFSSKVNFIEGYKYNLKLSVIGGKVSVAMGNPNLWDNSVDVNFEFE